MTIKENQLYLDFDETTRLCGVSDKYLSKAIASGIKCWQAIPDEDNRKLLIAWNTLKEKYRHLIIKAIGDPFQHAKNQQALSQLEELDDSTKELSQIVEAKIDNQKFEYFRKQMTRTEALDHTRTAAWLELLTTIKGKKETKKIGFESKSDLLTAALTYLTAHPLKTLKVTNMRHLQRRMRDYKKKGWQSIVCGRFNNHNAAILTTEGKRFLLALMSDPHKPPFPMLRKLYNREASKRGWKKIVSNTAANYLNQPSIKRKWMLGRHGEETWYQRFDVTIRRSGASAPDVLWVMDGSPLELYYQTVKERYNEKTGKWQRRTSHYNRAYFFFVIDAFSWDFIGWDLSTSENAETVRNAIKRSVKNRMTLPRQFQYDNGSAIIAQEFLLGNMAKLGQHNTPSRPYNPKSKIIEAVLGHFQDSILRYYDNFSGLNITAKRQDSRFNPDFVHANKHNFPTLDELKSQLTEAIEIWKNYETKERRAPRQLYTRKSKGHEVDTLAFLDLFWEKRKKTYIYHQDGIHLQYDNQEYLYQVVDVDFYLNHIRDRFEVAFDRDCADYIHLYQNGKPVLDKNGEPVIATQADLIPMALHDHSEGSRTRLNKLLNFKDEVKRRTEEEAEEIAEYAAENNVKLGARYVFKDELNASQNLLKTPSTGDSDLEDLLENEYLDESH